MRYAIIVASFYPDLAERLESGARRAFTAADVADSDLDRFEVPGAFELPLAAKLAAESGKYLGIVCLGAVIRGDTDHYEYVCSQAARGIQDVSLGTGVPCAFGVLTCENKKQALKRCGEGKRDQGYNSARTVLAMAELHSKLNSV